MKTIAYAAGLGATWYALNMQWELHPELKMIWLAFFGIFIFFAFGKKPDSEPSPRALHIAGILISFSVGIFFCFRYLTVFPIGYGEEALNFPFFAQKLVTNHFPYVPYAWYAHTLYSYIIAVALALTKSTMLALRIASATTTLLTLLFLYLSLSRNVSRSASWIGVFLMGSSTWLIWISRNGYHQHLIPLFHLAFLFFLFQGIAGKRRFWWFWGAGISMTLGLHSHYGFYLMIPIFAAFLVYLGIFHRSILKSVYKPLIASAILTLLMLAPLAQFYLHHQDFLGYFNNMAPAAGKAELLARFSRNLAEMFDCLFGNNPGNAVGSLILMILTFSGLLISLRRFRSSPFHAFVFMMAATNFAALLFTLAGIFYIVALMSAIYVFAATGFSTALDGFYRMRRLPVSLLAFSAVIAILTVDARESYTKFFSYFRTSHLMDALSPPGNAFFIMNGVQKDLKDCEVYLPVSDRERDFDTIPRILSENLEDFSFLLTTKPFDTATILIPAGDVLPGKRAAAIYLWNNGHFLDSIIEDFQYFYPGMNSELLNPPQPYPQTPIVCRLEIPMSDISKYWGYKKIVEQGEPDIADALNLVSIGRDDYYEFRNTDASGISLMIHDLKIDYFTADPKPGAQVYLEKGLHPIELGEFNAETGIEFCGSDKNWRKLDPFLLHIGSEHRKAIQPYLGSLGQATPPYNLVLDLKGYSDIQDAKTDFEGNLAIVDSNAFTLLRPDRSVIQKIPKPSNQRMNLARMSGNWFAIDTSGHVSKIAENAFTPFKELNAEVNGVDSDDQQIAILTATQKLIILRDDEISELELERPEGPKSLNLVDIAITQNGYFGYEFLTSSLYLFDHSGAIQFIKKIPFQRRFSESEIASDNHGNVFISTWNHGLLAYAPDGKVLHDPITGDRCIIARCLGSTNHLYDFNFRGKTPVGNWYRNEIVIFDRITGPAK